MGIPRIMRKRKMARLELLKKKVTSKPGAGKPVYCLLNGEVKAQYDSITKCANALGMTRADVKRAIDNQIVLENGFILSLTI
jgi:hypothetical protein